MIVRMEADVLGVPWDLADATGSGWSRRRRSKAGRSLGYVGCQVFDHPFGKTDAEG